ncbi:MAG: hypothetical protein GWN31_07720, partial [Candidatus Thorarchaeota archaeon]|nr:hypothetical protein [Candidatus Thorarchaeota archaeon]
YFKISYIKLLKWVRQELSNTQYPDSDDSDETVGYSDEDIDGDGEGDDTLRRMGVIR